MKMAADHYQQLQAMIVAQLAARGLDFKAVKAEYERDGLSATRLRWDCVWMIPAATRTPWFDAAYEYLNDDHIDTALRRIVAALDA